MKRPTKPTRPLRVSRETLRHLHGGQYERPEPSPEPPTARAVTDCTCPTV